MTKWTHDDLVYLAGLLDGESYLSPRDSGGLVVRMAAPSIIEWAVTTFGGRTQVRPPRESHHKQLDEWYLEKQVVLYELLPAVRPYLKLKGLECDMLIKLVEHAVKNKPPKQRNRATAADPDVADAWDIWHAERARRQQQISEARKHGGQLVLVVDPGERVGWVRAAVVGDHLEIVGHGITELKTFGLKINQVFGDYDVVVYESWRLAASMASKFAGNDFKTSQLIGMIRLSSWQNPCTKLVEQRPGNMKTGAKVVLPHVQEIMDRLPAAHDESHDRSALLHLSYWYWKNYVVPKENA